MRTVLASCLLLLLSTIMNLSCKKPPPPDTIATLTRDFGFALPAGVKVVGSQREDGDGMLRAKLLMSADQWREFAATSLVPVAEMDSDMGYVGANQGWWDPQGSVNPHSGSVNRPNGYALHIGYDDGDPNQVRVFIVLHGT